MLSYHNDPAIKAKYMARYAAHLAADEVIQRQGFKNGKGCFVGCTLDNYAHYQFPIELGWPEWLARLADTIFEGLVEKDAPQFGTLLLEAVPVGVDLEPVRTRFLLTVQRRNLLRMQSNTSPAADQVRAVIQQVIELLESNSPADASAWSAVESVAEAAALAAEAAWSAAWSACSAGTESRSAAESAEHSEFNNMSDDLLALCRECRS